MGKHVMRRGGQDSDIGPAGPCGGARATHHWSQASLVYGHPARQVRPLDDKERSLLSPNRGQYVRLMDEPCPRPGAGDRIPFRAPMTGQCPMNNTRSSVIGLC